MVPGGDIEIFFAREGMELTL